MFGVGCTSRRTASIAVVPRTTATPISESEYLGVHTAALQSGVQIYWNAPTREDDVEGQIALVVKTMERGYDGLVLSPDSATALTAPIQQLQERGIPVVVVGSRLSAPPSKNLCYLLNDEEVGARLAANRLTSLLHGEGTIALLGVNPDVLGIMDRARNLLSTLHQIAPRIRLGDLRQGNFDEDHERQVALDFFDQPKRPNAIVALSSATTQGLLEAMVERSIDPRSIKIVAFNRDDDASLLFDAPSLDSIIMEDAQRTGEEAVHQILRRRRGESMCTTEFFPPLLLTRENLAHVSHLLRSDMDKLSPAEQSRWMRNR